MWIPLQGYLQYVKGLPLNDSPELFGLHDNADITFAQNETFALLGAISQLQPKTITLGGHSREEVGAPVLSVPSVGSDHKLQLSAGATLPAGCLQWHCHPSVSSPLSQQPWGWIRRMLPLAAFLPDCGGDLQGHPGKAA